MTDSDVHRTRAVTPTRGRDGDTHAQVVRSEEHLQVTTETVPVGRVRVRKYAVTEEQTFVVPVTREEIAVDYEDIPEHEQTSDGNARLGADTYEVVRYEERVMITKQLVPVERVRLVRRVVTIDHIVTGQVRHELVDVEQVSADDDATPDR